MTCERSTPNSVLASVPAKEDRSKTGFCYNSCTGNTATSEKIDTFESATTPNPANFRFFATESVRVQSALGARSHQPMCQV
jgi:hypothetical protein